jgi:hypothetical protein
MVSMNVMKLIEAAQAASLTISVKDGRLLLQGPAESEALALRLLERKAAIIAALAVFDLAHAYDWQVAIIVGGGWRETDDGDRELILGEVVGGNEAHWRAFADRATDAQLREAA